MVSTSRPASSSRWCVFPANLELSAPNVRFVVMSSAKPKKDKLPRLAAAVRFPATRTSLRDSWLMMLPLLAIAAIPAVVMATWMVRPTAIASTPVRANCELPTGVSLAELPARPRSLLTARQILCADRQAGRIDAVYYHARLVALDLAFDRTFAAPPIMLWASDVTDFSSQYTPTSWSANQVLGAPNVPHGGDNVNAWASAAADRGAEFVEVTFSEIGPVSGVEVLETLNPGAVRLIELVTDEGERVPIYSVAARPAPTSLNQLRVDLPCTNHDVVAVRVTLDSAAVPGWNEIDAIGVRTCAP